MADNKQLQWEIDEAFLDFVANGNTSEAIDLLKNGKDGFFPNKNATTIKGLTALAICINKNNPNLFKKLLEAGVDPDYYETNGTTPLMLAVERKRYEFVEILLDHKANLEVEDKFGNTVLFTAIDANDENMVAKLLSSGANPNHKNKRHNLPIVLAAQKASVPIMEALLKNGGNVNTKDEYGVDLLNNAISFVTRQKKNLIGSQIELCKYLIENGADVNYRNNDGANALCLSLMNNLTYPLASLILDKGANPENLIYRDKLTEQMHPLHFAVMIESNKDNALQSQNTMFNDALGIAPPPSQNSPAPETQDINQNPNAIDENRFPVTEKLLKMQANPNVKDSDGNSPVAYAAVRNNDLLRLFLDHGGDPNTFIYQDKKRMPVLTKVILDKKEDIYQILRDKGAKLDFDNSDNEDDKKFAPFKAALQSGVSSFIADLAKETNLNVLWDLSPEGVSPLIYVLGPYLKEDLKVAINYDTNMKKLLLEAKGNLNGNIGKSQEELQEQKMQEMRNKQMKKLEFLKLDYELNQSVLKIVDILLNNNADVNFPNKFGQTPLFFCQTKQAAEYLIDVKGARFDVVDNNGNTPLTVAIKSNNKELISYYVDKAISSSLQNQPFLKDCILNLAFSPEEGYYKNNAYVNGLEHLLKYLKEKDEKLLKEMLNKTDENNNTPLIVAIALEQRTFAKHLLDYENNVNHQNNAGETAIFHAVATCDVAAAEMLLAAGADVDKKTNDNKSVIDCVRQLNNKSIIITFDNFLSEKEKKKPAAPSMK